MNLLLRISLLDYAKIIWGSMETKNESHSKKQSRACEARIIARDGVLQELAVEIPAEHVVHVMVNNQPAMVLTCTPSNIVELAVGRLFTEGLIGGADDIASVDLCERSSRVYVALRKQNVTFATRNVEQVNTCESNTKNFVQGQYDAMTLKFGAKIEIDSERIFRMADSFANDTPLHHSTLGVHSCSLFDGPDQLYNFEDIGRHNAFDKAIGAALIDDIDLSELAVFSSGRIPVDMIAKAMRASISLLVTKATPTTQAVAIARGCGLTLIGRARPDSFYIFSGGQALT